MEYKQYEAKIQLSNKFDLFLADDRIIRMVPQFLGKSFYKKKKIPLQINQRKFLKPRKVWKSRNQPILESLESS